MQPTITRCVHCARYRPIAGDCPFAVLYGCDGERSGK